MNDIDPKALFRLSVLGPQVSRERLGRGKLQPDRAAARAAGIRHSQFTPTLHQ